MKQSRLNQIERYVILNKTVNLDDLCEKFSVSKNTIRRDLEEICKRGRIVKTYGGVTAIEKDAMPIDVKIYKNASSKTEIAKLALEFIEDGDVIFIDAGTTAVNIINFLSTKTNITIISHSLNVIFEASKYKNLKVYGLGGTYIHETGSFVGMATLEMLKNIKITKSFMGTTGFSCENGLSVNTLLEAEIKREIVVKSNEIYVLCDSSKIGNDATMSFCDIGRIRVLITDDKIDSNYAKKLEKKGVLVIFAQNKK